MSIAEKSNKRLTEKYVNAIFAYATDDGSM